MKCRGLVHKDGFIAKHEIKSLANANGESNANTLRKLRTLADHGYIIDNGWGYVLTSTKVINNNLNLYSNRKTNAGTRLVCPFIKADANDLKQIEFIKFYFLIQQINDRYKFVSNGRRTSNLKKIKAPDMFQLSIDKIVERGQYTNKMSVWRMINQLENVGLICVQRGKKNDSGYIDCNMYRLFPLERANWNNINVSSRP